MNTEDLEGQIRRIDGVLSCTMNDAEVVVLLAAGAKASAIGSLVAHLVAESGVDRVVRIMSVTPAPTSAARPWALAGWIAAGVFAVGMVALVVALVNADDNGTTPVVAPARVTSTSALRTTSTTATSTTVTTAAEPPTTSPTTATPPTTTTSTTVPPPAFALERGECRQDDTTLTARGVIVNKRTSTHSYRVTVRFLDAAGHVAASGATDVPRVAPRERRDWIVQATYNGNLWANGGTCRASATVIG